MLILSLVALVLVDDANLADGWKQVVRAAFPLAAILLPIAYFLSIVRPDAERPNRLVNLAYLGAISLVVGYYVPRAFGVTGPQAIASSMEVGVHNATLAIFVAVEVLDEVEISVPAAVYSLVMFLFAALWGAWVSRQFAAREDLSVA